MADADGVLDKIAAGIPFASLASEFSSCASSARGGSLGSFLPGTMVPEFDKVIFSPVTIIGEVIGPVETKVRKSLVCVTAYDAMKFAILTFSPFKRFKTPVWISPHYC